MYCIYWVCVCCVTNLEESMRNAHTYYYCTQLKSTILMQSNREHFSILLKYFYLVALIMWYAFNIQSRGGTLDIIATRFFKTLSEFFLESPHRKNVSKMQSQWIFGGGSILTRSPLEISWIFHLRHRLRTMYVIKNIAHHVKWL